MQDELKIGLKNAVKFDKSENGCFLHRVGDSLKQTRRGGIEIHTVGSIHESTEKMFPNSAFALRVTGRSIHESTLRFLP